jgi:Uma2 family endonuclease
MAAAQGYISLARFEKLYKDQKPYYEYWFGEAIQKAMPTALHGTFQPVLAMILFQRGWKAATEVRLKLSEMAQPIPDLIADARRIEFPYPTEPFDLCVEILSPDDDIQVTFQKCAHYLDWRIGSAWIIDPIKRKAHIMTLESPAPVELDTNGVLTAGRVDARVSIPLAELFGVVDKMVGTSESSDENPAKS